MRKAILRHRSDVLQIAAIYSARGTSRRRRERGIFVEFHHANVYTINQLTLITFFLRVILPSLRFRFILLLL